MTQDPEAGLDLSRPDGFTASEQETFQAFYRDHKGATLPGHDFWMTNDPAVLKRYRRFAIEMNAEESRAWPQTAVLAWLHFYAVIGFEDGILYQIRNAQARGGATKAVIMATLETAFLHSGPLGTRAVSLAASTYLADYEDPEPVSWPPGWTVDPHAFSPGLTYESPGLTPEELDALRTWYRRTCGEVPGYVDFLARHRPEVLKSYWMRFEHAAGGALPKQMFTVLLLQWQLTRGSRAGVREAAGMARGVGVSKELALDAVGRAMIYSGPACATLAAEAAGDLFDAWDAG